MLNRWRLLAILIWMLLIPLGVAGAWWFVLYFHQYDVSAFLQGEEPHVVFTASVSRTYRIIVTTLAGLGLGMGFAYSLCHLITVCRRGLQRW